MSNNKRGYWDSNECLVVHEVFASIQGESTDVGRPCVFVRLFGCSIGCSFCDQPQCVKDKRLYSVKNLVLAVKRFGIPYVCITGGEPLEQEDVLYPFVYELLDEGYEVSIETSGCVPLEDVPYQRSYKYVMDVKCPSSGVDDKNVFDNFFKLRSNDEVKFVIKDRLDYEYALTALRMYQIPCQVLFSPVFEGGKPTIGNELVDWILEDKLVTSRVSLQIHKFLGVR